MISESHNRQQQHLYQKFFFRKIAGDLPFHYSRKQNIYNLSKRKKRRLCICITIADYSTEVLQVWHDDLWNYEGLCVLFSRSPRQRSFRRFYVVYMMTCKCDCMLFAAVVPAHHSKHIIKLGDHRLIHATAMFHTFSPYEHLAIRCIVDSSLA